MAEKAASLQMIADANLARATAGVPVVLSVVPHQGGFSAEINFRFPDKVTKPTVWVFGDAEMPLR